MNPTVQFAAPLTTVEPGETVTALTAVPAALKVGTLVGLTKLGSAVVSAPRKFGTRGADAGGLRAEKLTAPVTPAPSAQPLGTDTVMASLNRPGFSGDFRAWMSQAALA
jgi:hypothetical protein